MSRLRPPSKLVREAPLLKANWRLLSVLFCAHVIGLSVVAAAAAEETKVVQFQPDGVARQDTLLRYRGKVPDLGNITVCFRFRVRQLRELSSIFSYAVVDEPNELLIGFEEDTHMTLHCCGGVFQDLYNFSVTLRQWLSVCVAMDLESRLVSLMVDGNIAKHKLDTLSESQLRVRGGGLLLLGQDQDSYGGGFTNTQSLSGTLADLRVYDRVLSDVEMLVFGKCEMAADASADPIISFSNIERDFEMVNVDLLETTKERSCAARRDKILVFTEPLVFEKAKHICGLSGGKLALPMSDKDTWRLFNESVPFGSVCNTGSMFSFWLGVQGDAETQTWNHYLTGEPLSYTNFVGRQPVVENPFICVGFVGDDKIDSREHGGWHTVGCKETACPICHLDKVVLLKVRGLCKASLFDRQYFLTEDNGSVAFTGTHYSMITRHSPLPDSHANASDHGFWELARLDRPSVKATLQMKSPTHYPFGRHKWTVQNDVCGNDAEVITITSCKEGQFTCSDGSCIEIQQRCDMELDCPSGSDEMGCDFLTLEPSYNSDNPPPRSAPNRPVEVQIQLHIYAIESIDVDNFEFTCEVEVTAEWFDPRLRFRHLNHATELNSLSGDEKLPWTPQMEFLGDGLTTSDVLERRSSLSVRRYSDPLADDDEEEQASEVFAGKENSLLLMRKVTVTTPCQFDLEKFPFDEQECSMRLVIAGITRDYITVIPDEKYGISFSGRRNLLEYVLVKEDISKQDVGNYSGLEVHLYLDNLATYYITSTYVPTLIIVVIGYLVFFFPIKNFNERIMVGLTGLLVEATFFSQVNSSIPHTAYMKLVDIWMVFCILTLFQVVVSVVVIHWVLEKWPVKTVVRVVTKGFPNSIRSPEEQKKARAVKVNRFCKMLTPVVTGVFLLVYAGLITLG